VEESHISVKGRRTDKREETSSFVLKAPQLLRSKKHRPGNEFGREQQQSPLHNEERANLMLRDFSGRGASVTLGPEERDIFKEGPRIPVTTGREGPPTNLRFFKLRYEWGKSGLHRTRERRRGVQKRVQRDLYAKGGVCCWVGGVGGRGGGGAVPVKSSVSKSQLKRLLTKL